MRSRATFLSASGFEIKDYRCEKISPRGEMGRPRSIGAYTEGCKGMMPQEIHKYEF